MNKKISGKSKKAVIASVSAVLCLSMAMPTALSAFAATEDAVGASYFTSDYSSRQEVLKAGNDLARQITGEGIVLLKNSNKALPVATGSKVTVLGKNSVNPVYSGGGSGNGALGRGGDPVDLYEALEETGFKYNKTMRDFYQDNTLSGSTTLFRNWGMTGRTIGSPIGEAPLENYRAEELNSIDQYNEVAIVYLARWCSEGADAPRSSWQYNSTSNGYAAMDEDGNLIPVVGRSDGSQHYLELDDNEKDMVALAKERFKKVVVVINSGNPLELGELENDDGIDSIIWMGNPGGYGFLGLCDILNGTVNPSGHLTDTYAADFTKSPSYNNFSQGPTTSKDYDSSGRVVSVRNADYWSLGEGNAFIVDGTEDFRVGSTNYAVSGSDTVYSYNRYVKYKEGIYVGYRYWESMYSAIGEKVSEAAADEWYESRVVYPFGYGLSYTSFDWEVVNSKVNLNSPKALSTIRVKVTNTGDVAGKDVVQLYASAPEGAVDKASEVLAAYGKTEILKPGQSQYLELSFSAYDLASWDNDMEHDDVKGGYILDDGTYTFTLKTDSHNAKKDVEPITATKGEELKITHDPNTDTLLKRQFDVAMEVINGTTFDTLTVADMKNGNTAEEIEDYVLGTVLGRDTDAVRHINQAQLQELYENVYFRQTYTTSDAIDELDKDQPYFQGGKNEDGVYENMPAYAATAGEFVNFKRNGDPYLFNDLIGYAPNELTVTVYNSEGTANGQKDLYQAVVENATLDEIAATVRSGSHRITGINSIGMPGQLQEDGPGGFNTQADSMAFCNNIVIGATWNLELAEQMGIIMGEVALWENIGGWYAPSVNIHRSEFAGRNFEYFSEDQMLSGDMVAAQIRGATSKGLLTMLKHFALNEQDTDRGRSNDGVLTYADEQCIREIYLKPFEIAVKEGDATELMGSFNRIGNYWSSAYRPLNVDVLRGEWGFVGAVITDANSGQYMQPDFNIRGGVDYDLTNGQLSTGANVLTATTVYLIQECVKNIMYVTTQSNAINEVLGYIAEDGQMHYTDDLRIASNNRYNYFPLELGVTSDDENTQLIIDAIKEELGKVESVDMDAILEAIRTELGNVEIGEVDTDAVVDAVKEEISKIEGTDTDAIIEAIGQELAKIDGIDTDALIEALKPEINKAVQDAVAANTNNTPAEEEKGSGCNGSIQTGLYMIGGLALVGAAIVAVKIINKKRNKS